MAGEITKAMDWDPRRITDLSPDELRARSERAEMRKNLRKQYRMKLADPSRGIAGYIFDPVLQKYFSMHADRWTRFRKTPRNFAFFVATVPLPMTLLLLGHLKSGAWIDEECRAGRWKYEDRWWRNL